MKQSIPHGLIIFLAVFLVVGVIEADETVGPSEPIIGVEEMGAPASVVEKQIMNELSEDHYFYQSESDTGRLTWEYELSLPVETVTRRITLSRDNGVVKTSYFFDVGNKLNCQHVLDYIFRLDNADTMAREEKLFDVCKNVRSVGSDEIELRWKNEREGTEFNVELERDKRMIGLTYKMPFLGH